MSVPCWERASEFWLETCCRWRADIKTLDSLKKAPEGTQAGPVTLRLAGAIKTRSRGYEVYTWTIDTPFKHFVPPHRSCLWPVQRKSPVLPRPRPTTVSQTVPTPKTGRPRESTSSLRIHTQIARAFSVPSSRPFAPSISCP
jgi:hypothetical protein